MQVRRPSLIFTSALWMAGAVSVHAQSYPTKPIRFVVGFTAGGASDITARIVGQKLTEHLGQPVIIDNRAGASGTIAGGIVAKAPPDGYTLLAGATSILAINPALYAKARLRLAARFRAGVADRLRCRNCWSSIPRSKRPR
jgi:tripartite-type tricarboxylate transporter receptor subunit TctC